MIFTIIKLFLKRVKSLVYTTPRLTFFKLKPLFKNRLDKVVKYLLGDLVLIEAPKIAREQNLDAAIDYLLNAYKYYKPTSVRFLIQLYRYLQSLEIEDFYDRKKSVIIHFCCWGRDYCNKAKKYLLPSLLANNNLPLISKKNHITFLIHCDEGTRNSLIDSEIVKHIQKYSDMKLLVIPKALMRAYEASLSYPRIFSRIASINRLHYNKYLLMGGLQNHALKIALDSKAYVSFLMPDAILSDSFLEIAFSKIKNKKAVVTTTFRTSFHKIQDKLNEFYKKKTVLSLSSETLTELQIKNMHHDTKKYIVSEDTENFSFCPQLIFKKHNGFIIRSFHYHPFLVDCDKITHHINITYRGIDSSLLNQIMTEDAPYSSQIWVCNDSKVISVMELSDEHIGQVFCSSKNTFTYNEFIQLFKQAIKLQPSVYNLPPNRYLASIRHQIISKNIYNKGTYINDTSFFSDAYNALD